MNGPTVDNFTTPLPPWDAEVQNRYIDTVAGRADSVFRLVQELVRYQDWLPPEKYRVTRFGEPAPARRASARTVPFSALDTRRGYCALTAYLLVNDPKIPGIFAFGGRVAVDDVKG